MKHESKGFLELTDIHADDAKMILIKKTCREFNRVFNTIFIKTILKHIKTKLSNYNLKKDFANNLNCLIYSQCKKKQTYNIGKKIMSHLIISEILSAFIYIYKIRSWKTRIKNISSNLSVFNIKSQHIYFNNIRALIKTKKRHDISMPHRSETNDVAKYIIIIKILKCVFCTIM